MEIGADPAAAGAAGGRNRKRKAPAPADAAGGGGDDEEVPWIADMDACFAELTAKVNANPGGCLGGMLRAIRTCQATRG
jgi:hypothetical protein